MRRKLISGCALSLAFCLASPGLLAQESEDAAPVKPAAPTEDSAQVDAAPSSPLQDVVEEEEPVSEEQPDAPEEIEAEEALATDDALQTPEAAAPSPVTPSWNAGIEEAMARYRWRLALGGYIRVQYVNIEDDPSGTFGLNDGFGLANARFSLGGKMRDSLGFKFQFDGAVARSTDANSRGGQLVMELKDVYLYWQPLDLLRLQVGQFKAPFDAEELISTADILFVERSVGSRGVDNIEGFNVDGLSLSREVGAMLTSGDTVYFGGDEVDPGLFGVSYSLATTNGASSRNALNDNDDLAYYGRLALHWGELIRLGGAYYVNDATVGEPPDQIGSDQRGWTADLTFTGYGFTALGTVIGTELSYPELGDQPDATALAYQASIAYQEPYFGFQPAFRYAYYDPTASVDDPTDVTGTNDALTYYTAGLNYNPRYPVRLMLNYTFTTEQEGRELDNDRFDALLQVVW